MKGITNFVKEKGLFWENTPEGLEQALQDQSSYAAFEAMTHQIQCPVSRSPEEWLLLGSTPPASARGTHHGRRHCTLSPGWAMRHQHPWGLLQELKQFCLALCRGEDSGHAIASLTRKCLSCATLKPRCPLPQILCHHPSSKGSCSCHHASPTSNTAPLQTGFGVLFKKMQSF